MKHLPKFRVVCQHTGLTWFFFAGTKHLRHKFCRHTASASIMEAHSISVMNSLLSSPFSFSLSFPFTSFHHDWTFTYTLSPFHFFSSVIGPLHVHYPMRLASFPTSFPPLCVLISWCVHFYLYNAFSINKTRYTSVDTSLMCPLSIGRVMLLITQLFFTTI